MADHVRTRALNKAGAEINPATEDTLTSGNMVAQVKEASGSASGALGALNDTVSIACSGYNSAVLWWSATAVGITVRCELSYDNGASWRIVTMFRLDTIAALATTATANVATHWGINLRGATNVRQFVSGYTSGSVTGYINLTTSPITQSVNIGPGTSNIGDVDVLTLPSVTLASQNNPFASAVPVNTKTALTASAPAAATVGIASAQAVASNASRKGLALINTSANWISFGLGAAAVLYSGITLAPNGGTWVMDEYTFTTAAVNAIASVASSNLAIQEYT